MKNKRLRKQSSSKNRSILKFKDGQTLEQVTEKLIRDYLLRCYSEVSKQYLPIANMKPEEGADCLLKLKKEGKVKIEFDTVGEHIICSITPID
jgi:hypothetical protein